MQTSTPTYLIASSLVTPLGAGTEENFNQLLLGKSGIQMMQDERFFSSSLPLAKIDEGIIEDAKKQFNTCTRFDSILLKCVDDIEQKSIVELSSKDVLIILSTTKGNIELLKEKNESEKLLLSYSARLIQQKLNNPNAPLVVSNACISGLSAIIIAKRLLISKQYKHAVIIGCDVLSNFVISGFNSFHAISNEPCKPFDKNRKGITLGEACAAMVLSTEIKSEISVLGGYISNDANHISGPSKTGEELSYCINASMKDVAVKFGDIDFISAHGTATEYNDEMESKAFEHSQLSNVPVFSLKAVYGHTLGASGILETIISAECLKQHIILPSVGFAEKGVSGDIRINKSFVNKPLYYCLKTASGFGGCNAALILRHKK